MTPRIDLLILTIAIVLLPWLVWRIPAVRRFAPLAVLQILAGVLLGPSLLGRVAPDLHAALFGKPIIGAMDGLSTLGVLLYVFVTGLHLDSGALRKELPKLGGIALGSVVVPLALGAGVAWWLLGQLPDAIGPRGGASGFIAATAICVAVTALPVLAAVLQEMGLIGTRLGQRALLVAALNDASLWIMLAVLLAVAGPKGGESILLRLGTAAVWVAVMVGLIRPGLRALSAQSETTILVCGITIGLVSAAVSEALGTGYLIGAFLAGAIMPAGAGNLLRARIEPLTAVFLLPFFFMQTGLKAFIDPTSASFLMVLVLTTAATIIGKILGAGLPARLAGFAWPEALTLGAMLQTKGLMEVVVLAVLQNAGLIGREVFSALVAMAVICTVITAPIVRLCLRGQAAVPTGTVPSRLG